MDKISLHIPCMVNTFMPGTGRSAIRLLERLGIPFDYNPDQTCCGLPAYNAGFVPETRKVAKHFIEVFEENERVVSLSGSCVSMVRDHYMTLFADEPDWQARARQLAGRVYELTQYLVDVLAIHDVGGRFEGKIAYHESCSLLRGIGVSEQPKQLLRSLKGAELVELQAADVCCGFGGEFAHAYHEISEKIVADKVNNFLQSGADVLTMGEPGCFLNVSGYISRHHPERKVTAYRRPARRCARKLIGVVNDTANPQVPGDRPGADAGRLLQRISGPFPSGALRHAGGLLPGLRPALPWPTPAAARFAPMPWRVCPSCWSSSK